MENPPATPASRAASAAVRSLYDTFLQDALRRFFDRVRLVPGPVAEVAWSLAPRVTGEVGGREVVIEWLGRRYRLEAPLRQPFTGQEHRLVRAVTAVLAARYRAISTPEVMAEHGDLFHGAVEDRYVGAFLDPRPYTLDAAPVLPDRVAKAIDVLRIAAVSSYENRLISTGLLLLGSDHPDPGRRPVAPVPAGQRYGESLTGIKTFYRLADGLHTLFLVGLDDMLVDVVDIERWASEAAPESFLAAPCAQAYQAHARATAAGGHVCLVLSPFHEMKVFAEGAQLFSFRNASWRLLDVEEKFRHWVEAVGSFPLAERLFRTALDLADAREGALFVVLRDPRESVAHLVSPVDRLDVDIADSPAAAGAARRHLLRLLTGRSVTDMDTNVLASLATVDGAVVLDRAGTLIAAGAILRHPPTDEFVIDAAAEGARTTAALVAARFGAVLKVSEDGVISGFDGPTVWEI